MKTITVTISPNGGTVIKTAGYTGTTCKDATRQLEKALGTVQDDRPCKDAETKTQHTANA